jgi:competence protein ComEC
VVFLSLLTGTLAAQSKALQIYVVDVEGGNATLFVTPSGESVLIDTGNPGARDADRIAAAAKDAGLQQIDHVITTHWHGDHFGGMADVAARIPSATSSITGRPPSRSRARTSSSAKPIRSSTRKGSTRW